MSAEEAWVAFKTVDGEVRALVASAAGMLPAERQRQLLIALNKLEVTLLQLPDIQAGDEVEQGSSTYVKWREVLRAAFPELGLFHMAAPNAEGSREEAVLHDAHDDLADILNGLDRFAWFEREQGWENAVWEAKFDYETHLWLAHLQPPRLCLQTSILGTLSHDPYRHAAFTLRFPRHVSRRR